MNITVIADVFGEGNNGTSITARRLVDNMKERGHNVTVVSPYDGGEGFIKLPQRRFIAFNNYINNTNGVCLGAPDDELLRQGIKDADVVHLLLPFKVSRRAIEICREMKIPYTTAFHAQPENISSHVFMQNFTPLNNYFYNRFRRVFYKDAEFIHCPSQFIANQLTKHKYPGQKYVISNGVIPVFQRKKAEKDEALKDKICILFIGRLVGEKRHDLLIKAVKKSKFKDKIQLIFAGNGPKRKKLERMGKSLPNPPIIKLFDKEELCRTINFCDLYVHPSDIEIEAISCIEAFSCGLVPVISDSSRSATNQFALDEKNLFKHGNASSLAKRIDYWLTHDEEKQALGDKYVEYAKQFAIQNCMNRMEQMFYDAIAFYSEYYKQQDEKEKV